MTFAILIFCIGIFLSAFFSGSETGLYRVTRVRLVIDALGGDKIARGLLWLTNRPSVFVATVLVGNNIANYLVSLSIVLLVGELFPSSGEFLKTIMPVLLAPIVFIYGESMPKTLFFLAPNRFLRKSGPPLMLASILFAPVILLLWIISRTLQAIVGESPQKLRLGLARRELAQVLDEGHEVGILHPSQQALSKGLFVLASHPVTDFMTPVNKMPVVIASMSRTEVLALAQRHRANLLPIQESKSERQIIGFVRIVDLLIDETNGTLHPQPLTDIRAEDGFLTALIRLQKEESTLGRVLDQQEKTVGYVTARQLSKLLFRGQEWQEGNIRA